MAEDSYRMPCPQCSPPGLYARSPASLTPCSYPLMLQCWAEDADERPTFEHLMTALLVCVKWFPSTVQPLVSVSEREIELVAPSNRSGTD